MRHLLPLALAVTACAPLPEIAEPTGPCSVSDAIRARYIGTKFRERVRDDIRHDANARIARVLRPDDAATTDVREDRLDILVDDFGQIEGLRCGGGATQGPLAPSGKDVA